MKIKISKYILAEEEIEVEFPFYFQEYFEDSDSYARESFVKVVDQNSICKIVKEERFDLNCKNFNFYSIIQERVDLSYLKIYKGLSEQIGHSLTAEEWEFQFNKTKENIKNGQ